MVTIGIVGYGKWEKYTLPCIRSIQEHEPDANVVVIDNGSETAYPDNDLAQIVRIERTSFSAAMNTILRLSPSDWYIMLNNDTTCTGKFLHLFDDFDTNNNYGCRMLKHFGIEYLESWITIFSHQTFEKVGEWDEKFLVCAFEDADWGFRSIEAGIGSVEIDFPFVHDVNGVHGTRFDVPNYRQTRVENMEYLKDKWNIEE